MVEVEPASGDSSFRVSSRGVAHGIRCGIEILISLFQSRSVLCGMLFPQQLGKTKACTRATSNSSCSTSLAEAVCHEKLHRLVAASEAIAVGMGVLPMRSRGDGLYKPTIEASMAGEIKDLMVLPTDGIS